MNATKARGRPRIGAASGGSSPIVQARLDRDEFERFTARCVHESISASELVRRAISAYLNSPNANYAVSRYRDARIDVIPESLADLRGPGEGELALPQTIKWSPGNKFDLGNRIQLIQAYRTIITEGSSQEMESLLNRQLLTIAWPSLGIHGRIADEWEARFPELRRIER